MLFSTSNPTFYYIFVFDFLQLLQSIFTIETQLIFIITGIKTANDPLKLSTKDIYKRGVFFMKTFKKIGLVVLLGILSGFIALGAAKGVVYIKHRLALKDDGERVENLNKEIASIRAKKEEDEGISSLKVGSDDYSNLVDAVAPCVCQLTSSYTVTSNYLFFSQDSTQNNYGTGFLVGRLGSKVYIATNSRAVDNVQTLSVILENGTELEGMVVGKDYDYDLGVVSIDINDLSTEDLEYIRIARLGDSKELNCGDCTVILGDVEGYGLSVSLGHVSATDRKVSVDGFNRNYIQTDCNVNSSNYGGPVFDVYGRVVGISSSSENSDGVEGIGYIIPVSDVEPLIREYIYFVDVPEGEEGYLDAKLKNITEAYATAFNLPIGIYVTAIPEDSVVKESNLRVGDVIIGLNGRSIETVDELNSRLDRIRAGEKATFTVSRYADGEISELDIEVTLSNRPKAKTKDPSENPKDRDIRDINDLYRFFFN